MTELRFVKLDTPVLTVNLDAVDRNIRRVQSYCDEHGFACRPHIKTHKLPAVAHMQVDAGAVGITCQKLGEAEVMAATGIKDILVSFPLIGEAKAARLAALARLATITVVGGSERCALDVSAALVAEGLEIDFLVECDTGLRRTGVQTPRQAANLAQFVDNLPGLRFAGLMTYPTSPESGPFFREARLEIESHGLQVTRVSGGGTPGYAQTHTIGEVTEVRCGTYVYGDRACVANGTHELEDCALRVHATVVSRPTGDRAILDVGSKTLTNDGVEADVTGFGHAVEYPGAALYQLHEEHGFLDVRSCADGGPDVGQTVTIVPNHACGTTAMHDEVVVHRGDHFVGVWPVAARGRLR